MTQEGKENQLLDERECKQCLADYGCISIDRFRYECPICGELLVETNIFVYGGERIGIKKTGCHHFNSENFREMSESDLEIFIIQLLKGRRRDAIDPKTELGSGRDA